MIDPKYADLPGIAYDQPDIYETDDTLEGQGNQDYIEDDGNSVEKIYVNPTDAFNQFKDKRVNTKDVDFSDTISSKKKTGYNVSGKELYCRDEDETPVERYERLKQEIHELIDQVNNAKENPKENEELKALTDIVHQIEITGKELDDMNINKLLNGNSITNLTNYQEIRFKELTSQIEIFKQKNSIESSAPSKEASVTSQDGAKVGTLKYQMTYYPDKAKVQDIARISHLEKRLGYLENVIGISNESNTKCSQILKSQGITKSIEKLMANACLLNSAQLDILENKVTSLINKMDSVIQKKAMTAQDSRHEKVVTELYDLVKQSEHCVQILPQTIDRMLSLSALHRKAAEFANQLKELEDLKQNISGSLTNNKILLEEMQTNFTGNLEIIAKDITALNDRVKKLQK
ncbi:dynactin subunit 2 isoform X1 [Nasonia vitripennis]|uniref:Dynactin subunit 2 n=1 Tax=Nasonia vitripennis TaxID=7425 RepID=A0A7M7PW04_NASVI|nr:dynactin subunit 2 [Nasonia vitripennis]XP_031777516.1 dynactin subunit 2 isoform X1 [Nasonia vitripennis]XP_031777517.1 dynactin subunit 2 isoform X1 [Nasonia vitripennis]XP_032456992.1 dynactin subunit 2 isoform X1 [Nasonia vitripennis]